MLFRSKCYRRSHVIGNLEYGVIAALDLEGRLFTILNGQIINRVSASAIEKRSNKYAFQNPGGDVLWPAPEGTTLGYEYTTAFWRVPPSISGSVWEVVSTSENNATIKAEIDLINNQQIGLPCEFERHIRIEPQANSLIVHVKEIIRYVGKKTIYNDEFLLAPWSLCQFDTYEFGKVVIPVFNENDVWDMYDSSEDQRTLFNSQLIVDTKTTKRFQIALSDKIECVEYIVSDKFRVKRSIVNAVSDHRYIDIADLPPDKTPSDRGVKLSVYCDPLNFMEIEGCGKCPDKLTPGMEMSVGIITEYVVSGS